MCSRIQKGLITRQEAILSVSDLLRSLAVARNYIIDDKFRNVNGIAMQLSTVDALMKNKKSKLGESKVFREIVGLYNHNRKEFDFILAEAKAMLPKYETSENKLDNIEEFVDWLKTLDASTAKHSGKIVGVLQTLSKLLLKQKITDFRILQNTNAKEITELANIVEEKKHFFFNEPKEYKVCIKALRLYLKFLNRKMSGVSSADKNAIDIEEKVNPSLSEYEDKISDNEEKSDLITKKAVLKADFAEWMLDQGLAAATARSYCSALNSCDNYAHEYGLYSGSVLDCQNISNFNLLYNQLITNNGFLSRNEVYHNSLSAALRKYSEFLCAGCSESKSASIPITNSGNLAQRYTAVLSNEFADGYRIGNYMHQIRYISCYEELYGERPKLEGGELDAQLKKVGVIIDDKIYAVDVNGELCSEICDALKDAFENGASMVYLEALIERFGQRLAAEMKIYGEEALRDFLKRIPDLQIRYIINKTGISKIGSSKDTNSEIKEVLKNSHVPLTYNEIHEKMWYIPVSRIKTALNQIPEAAYVNDSSYFYALNFNLSPNELSKLVAAMHNAIYSKGYIVTKDLRKVFRENCPTAAMDSENYKDYAIREIIKVLLRDKFNFTAAVITEIGEAADIGSIYENYASEHEKLTLSEIKEFSRELGISIYWNSILNQMIRISSTDLINKKLIEFDIDAIDEFLETLCDGDYIALKDITMYLSFPAFKYKWNGFVLESYLRGYSKKFRLIQLSVSADNFIGAMVRTNSKFNSFEDIAADYLANNNAWNDESSALQRLVDGGFQQRKRNENISSIIKAAKQIRIAEQ